MPQKRKLLDEGMERKREAELKELYDGISPGRTYLRAGLNLGGVMGMGGRVLGEACSFSPALIFFPFCFDVAAMKDWVSDLNKNNAELNEKL